MGHEENYKKIAVSLSQGEIQAGHTLHLTVTSSSMAPLLIVKDVVHVEPIAFNSLHFGDIVLTISGDEYVTHRLVSKQGGFWLTKGDRNRLLDMPHGSDALVGRVIARERIGRTISLATGWYRWSGSVIAWISWQEGRLFQANEAHLRWMGWVFRCLGRTLSSTIGRL